MKMVSRLPTRRPARVMCSVLKPSQRQGGTSQDRTAGNILLWISQNSGETENVPGKSSSSPCLPCLPQTFTYPGRMHLSKIIPISISIRAVQCIPFRVKRFSISTDTSRMVSCISMVLLTILQNISFLLHIHKVSHYGSLATPNNVTFWETYFLPATLVKLENRYSQNQRNLSIWQRKMHSCQQAYQQDKSVIKE